MLNDRGAGDRILSPPGSPIVILALATNEELIVARRAYAGTAALFPG
jgi:acetate kinase